MLKNYYLILIAGLSLLNLSCGSEPSSTDADEDGIPDVYEKEGSTLFGMPLYEWGARPDQKDLFVHIAMMEPYVYSDGYPDGGMILQKKALDRITAKFAENGIAIHFDAGSEGLYEGYTELSGRGTDEYNLSNISHMIPYNQAVTLSESVLPSAWSAYSSYYVFVDDLKSVYLPPPRWMAFHFLVIGSSQVPDGSGGSSGIAWIDGRDFLVTLGSWGFGFGTYDNGEGFTLSYDEIENWTVNSQASTIMHELGHNLGLRHGGNVNTNYMPNYVSIMNYLYQLSGLPLIGGDEGDRYYFEEESYSDYFQALAGMEQSIFSDDFDMDYSHGLGGDLDESSLLESQGLMQAASSDVDWDLDDTLDVIALSRDINQDGSSKGSFSDYDDWENLYLYYANKALGGSRSAVDTDLRVIVEDPPERTPPDIRRSVR
ncbi:MAG: zinc-dependent metalloprotease family protein [Spirochaetales bacterium]|nr:zinc-dependent metalloprotease family protein [Spirochaetales bacterium]